jgi:hypothetical protein
MENFGNISSLVGDASRERVHGAYVAVSAPATQSPPFHGITNPMELSLSSEAASCVATQEFLNILWNRKFVTVKAVTD